MSVVAHPLRGQDWLCAPRTLALLVCTEVVGTTHHVIPQYDYDEGQHAKSP